MPEWKALNVRECVSGPKPKLCESTLPWKLKLNLLLRTRHTGRQGSTSPLARSPEASKTRAGLVNFARSVVRGLVEIF